MRSWDVMSACFSASTWAMAWRRSPESSQDKKARHGVWWLGMTARPRLKGLRHCAAPGLVQCDERHQHGQHAAHEQDKEAPGAIHAGKHQQRRETP